MPLPHATPTCCPEPLTRAPRIDLPAPATAGAATLTARPRSANQHTRLTLPPPALQGALVALISRDTQALTLNDAQRLSHFPASPLLCLSWYQGMQAQIHRRDGSADAAAHWQRLDPTVVVSGSQSHPTLSWAPSSGRGGMLCFTADVARALFGLDPAALIDRFVPAREVLPRSLWPLCQALAAATDDAATLTAVVQHLAPRWQALQGRPTATPSLGQLGRHWVDRLAWQAHDWQRTHSRRQVERRVKAYSGRSLREWRALVQTEGVFATARARHEAGEPFQWAELALDEGFVDQAHLVRAAKRITGFAPGEFASRFEQDESFWIYRLWV
jgi:AraC-like DNA-binding protein